MPTVSKGSKVLVTGASGFIACWVVKVLLERGFNVRGTVRTRSKGEYLTKLFKDHGDRFEYIVVEDISKEGAFDEAVKNVDAVEHTASPYHFKADDPQELINPAVKGTTGILESILKYGPSVQRVIITASFASIVEPTEHQEVFTEKRWNGVSTKEVEEKGRNASGLHKYRASKTLAELAAWDFANKYKDKIKWDVVSLNPPVVWGPIIHEISSTSSLNTSMAGIYALIKGNNPVSAAPVGNWIDVRDLAQAHVDALLVEKAGGERFLVGSGPYTWQDFIDAVHANDNPAFADIPKGTPGAGKGAIHPALLDTTKARTILGSKFRELEETARDSVLSLLEKEKELGW